MKVTHGLVNLQYRSKPAVALNLLFELTEIIGASFQVAIKN